MADEPATDDVTVDQTDGEATTDQRDDDATADQQTVACSLSAEEAR